MVRKAFKELYAVDRISQNKGWIKLREALDALDTKDDILIDFTGINVSDPWDCPDFINILKNPKLHMLFKNKDELVTRIKMTCILNGAYPDNIENIEIEKPKEKTAEEKKIEQYGEGLRQIFGADERYPGALVIDLGKKYTQLHNTATINYLKYAIDKLHEETGQTHYIAIVGKTNILDNVLELLANIIVKYKSQGIVLEVDLDNPDAETKIGLYLHKATAKVYSIDEKIKFVKEHLVKGGMPGILIRYKKSRSLDNFGRYGKGEVISSRIAIIRGMEYRSKDHTPVIVVESYNNDYFFTGQHWLIEHDNEQLQSVRVDKLEISLDELGFLDSFLGSTYHFMEPIPLDDTDNCKVIVAIDEDGKNVIRSCTLPERMKYVFDDWGIEYNDKYLDGCIEKTAELQNKGYTSKRKQVSSFNDDASEEPIDIMKLDELDCLEDVDML